MEACNGKTIGHWLNDVEDSRLCLPRFQRKLVWKPKMVKNLLESIILKPDMPVGMFLVLETGSENPPFPPRNIKGTPDKTGMCRELLLDGQQRLTALWKALHKLDGGDNDYRYYAEFNEDSWKIQKIAMPRSFTRAEEKRTVDPKKQFKKKWFPLWLLNPTTGANEISQWAKKASKDAVVQKHAEEMINSARKLFSKRGGGKVIPYFKLSDKVGRKEAVDVYKTINTNAVKLSQHYLAVAHMEKETGKSLYDIADELKSCIPGIDELESDELGELILKVACLWEGKAPSGSNYRNLRFNKLIDEKKKIIEGIKWAVSKLAELKIWYSRELPTVVPLRVLPALHVEFPAIENRGPEVKKAIKRYLWHAFLTDRYTVQANTRLKEDYDNLCEFIKAGGKGDPLAGFKDAVSPEIDDIKEAGWPQNVAKSILPRGLLLVCCLSGAKTLKGDKLLNKEDLQKSAGPMYRERHHVFPKSKVKEKGNIVMNCILVPREENQQFSNSWPGDYMHGLFADSKDSFPQIEVVDRLATHCIEKSAAEYLIRVTDDAIKKDPGSAEEAFTEFINERAKLVKKSVDALLEKGEL